MKSIKNIWKGGLFMIAVLSTSVTFSQSKSEYKAEVEQLKAELKQLAVANEVIAKNLEKFDELDFKVFTNQEWKRLHESHSKDILVHWPDGHTTTGIEKHIEDLAGMFVYAPNTRIKEHPIRIGSGKMTAVMGVIEGTFTKPMPIGGGKFIEPTGKAYKLNMVTIGLWNDEGVMYEEYLFWDNLTFMQQIGLQ